ncbi:hypothetical protein [Kribbella sp. NPDC048915]|uniref:hypothetical protein n=1 Tax=Kribbella sp. NPDC048915 TaxID=3155148 RepID=UPI0033EB3581
MSQMQLEFGGGERYGVPRRGRRTVANRETMSSPTFRLAPAAGAFDVVMFTYWLSHVSTIDWLRSG